MTSGTKTVANIKVQVATYISVKIRVRVNWSVVQSLIKYPLANFFVSATSWLFFHYRETDLSRILSSHNHDNTRRPCHSPTHGLVVEMGKGGMNRDGITVRPLYHEIDPWKVRMGLFLCLSLEVYSYCKLEWFSHATVVEWGGRRTR